MHQHLTLTIDNISGNSLIRILRSNWIKLPEIVIFSALDGSKLKEEKILAAGANSALTRARNIEELKPLLETVLFNEPKRWDA